MGLLDYFSNMIDSVTSAEGRDETKRKLAEHNKRMLQATGADKKIVDKVVGELDERVSSQQQQERINRTGVAAIPRILTGGPELVNLAGQAIDAFSHPAVNADGTPRSFLERLADAKYGDDPKKAKEVTEKRIALVKERQKKGDKRDFTEIYDDVGKTPEFKKFEEPRIPFVRRYTDKAAAAIDTAVGAPLDEDKTTPERVLTTGVQSLIPTTFIQNALRKTPAPARFLADMALPGTSNYTKGGVGTNIGVGGAVTAGVDTLLGNEATEAAAEAQRERNRGLARMRPPPASTVSPLAGVVPTVPEKRIIPPPTRVSEVVEEDDDGQDEDPQQKSKIIAGLAAKVPEFQQLAIGGLSIAALFGGKQAARQAAANAAKNAAANAAKAAPTTKPGVIPQGPLHTPANSRRPAFRSALSETAPGRAMMDELTKSKKKTNAAVNSWSQHARSNVTSQVEAWRTAGHAENMPEGVVSGRQARLIQDTLRKNGEDEQFRSWKIAKTVLERRGADLQRAEANLRENLTAQSVANTTGDWKKLRELRIEYKDLSDEVTARQADAPEHRGAMVHQSYGDLKKIADAGDLNPQWVDLDNKVFKKGSVDLLRYLVRGGTIDKKTAKLYRDTHVNHMYLQDDPFAGKKGFGRFTQKLRAKFRVNDNPYGDNMEFMGSLNPLKMRRTKTDAPINNPVDPFDAYDMMWENAIRFHNRNAYKHNVIADVTGAYEDALRAGRTDIQGAVKQFEMNGTKEFSVDHIKALMADNKVKFNPDHWVSVMENGKLKFYQFPQDKLMNSMLQQAPSTSIPILRGMSRFWRAFTTGAGNPGFLERNLVMETKGFNAQRPAGTRYGTDYVIDRAMSVTPKSFQEALRPLKEPVLGAVRTATTVIDPVAYMLNMGQVIHTWAKQNEAWIARSITEGLAQDEGFFATIAKSPQGKQFLETLAANANKAFEQSYVSTLYNNHAVDLAVMKNLGIRSREIDTLFETRLPRWARYATSPAYFAMQQYRFFVNSMQEAARIGYAYRNWDAIHDAAGNVDPKLAKKLYSDVRTTASGDLSKLPGNPIMQAAVSSMPFTNVMMRSTQNLAERIREDPKVATMFMSGVLMPTLWGMYVMNNWDKAAYDYYNREMPRWKRSAYIVLPTPETMYKWHVLGEKVPFTKDAVWEVQLLPEHRPYAQAVAVFMSGLGVFGAGQRDPLTGGLDAGNALESIGQAFKDAFGPTIPPVVSGFAKLAGVDIEPGNLFMLPAVIAGDESAQANPFQAGGGGSTTRAGETMNLGSDINKGIVDITSAVAGTMIGRFLQAYDTGTSIYRDTGKLDAALWGAGKEVVQRTVETPEDIPLIRKGHDRVYRRNDVNIHAQHMRSYFKLVTGAGGQRKPTGEDLLDDIAATVRAATKSGEYKAFNKQWKLNDTQYKALESLRTLDYNTREKEKSRIQRTMNKDDKQQGRFLQELVKDLGDMYGKDYEKAYGEKFTMEAWAKRFKKASNMQKRELGLELWQEGKEP